MRVKPGSEGGVPGLSRGLATLEYLCSHSGGARIRTVAEALGVPDNTMIRILGTLAEHGYVERDPDSLHYLPTRKVVTLAGKMADDRHLITCALGPMRDLRDKVSETVLLAVWDRTSSVIVEQVQSHNTFRFVCDYGHRPTLHVSASPKAIIAFLPEAEQKRALEGYIFKKYTEHTITTRTAFEKELQAIRKRGYAFDLHEEVNGMLCAAAPVFNRERRPIASVTVTGPDNRIDMKRELPVIASATKACADEITRCYTDGLTEKT